MGGAQCYALANIIHTTHRAGVRQHFYMQGVCFCLFGSDDRLVLFLFLFSIFSILFDYCKWPSL